MNNPKPIPFTKEGYEKIKEEKKSLELRRKEAVLSLKTAREMGDLSENAAYKVARMELSSIDHRLRRIQYLLAYGRIADNAVSGNWVSIGTTVKITDDKTEKTFSFVGDFEANPALNKISGRSPIGKALMGKRVGDEITISVPNGSITYRILSIQITQ